jgi:alpha-1,2-mannosyltransferase
MASSHRFRNEPGGEPTDMTSNDANGVAKALGRSSLRRDDAVGANLGPIEAQAQAQAQADNNAGGEPGRNPPPAWWARLERAWWKAFLGAILVFSAVPLINLLLDFSTKDYELWYKTGVAERQGLDIYPRPESNRLFPFMYPPSAAAMLAPLSLLGPTGTLLALVLATSASWLASIALSIRLAVGPGGRRHPLLTIVPSLSVIVLIYNVYLLGQPNLLLLALVLGAFACLRVGWPFVAGALVATAAAIKAFPLMILGYFVYRRMWTASAATVLVLLAWLLVAPLPFRTPVQAVGDLVVWSRGMVFTYNTYGIAQRPFRSYSYKNQSIMGLAHRLLRDVPADGESVLSKKAKAGQPGPRPAKGLAAADPSPTTDRLSFLKPHSTSNSNASADSSEVVAENAERPGRWDDVLQAAEPALRSAWRVNVVDLDFVAVTAITGAAVLSLCLFVVAVLPRASRRTRQTDVLEFAIVTLLTVMFSPLSFNYAYVWLLFPTTVGLHLVVNAPRDAPWRRLKVAWISAVLLIPALAIPFPQGAQAYGNLFVPALLLLLGFGVKLHALGRESAPWPRPHSDVVSQFPMVDLVEK